MALIEQLEHAFGHQHDCYYRPMCAVCWARAYRDLFRLWFRLKVIGQ